MPVSECIAKAERLLPGTAAPDPEIDPRWQAIVAIGAHIESEPEAVWAFVARWGVHADSDLRAAIDCSNTC